MKTKEERLAYILGYLEALAKQHADEFERDVDDVKVEILKEWKKQKEKPSKFVF